MSARVKSITSGDTLVLVDKASGAEVQLSLAYVSAPRLTEAWGFEAREYLRTFALAKPVSYRVLYDVGNRSYGDAASPVFSSLAEHLLAKGWVKLRDDAASKPGFSDVVERLAEAESQAKSHELGIWTLKRWPGLNIRTAVPESLYNSGRQVPAIVERVISGDRVVLRAMLDPDDHFVGHAMLAGIRTHRTTSTSATGSTVGDALGDAAAAAVANKLLQRPQVRAIFLAPAKNNPDIPLVTLQHPQGDIALVLVQNGLAEVTATPEIGANRLLELRDAQLQAEQKGLGLFRAAAAARKQHSETYSSKSADAVVIKVLSSDTVVLHPGNQAVQLSSTRAPRRNEDPTHAADAREFARKLLIGQNVRIQVDGETTNPNTNESRQVVTLSLGAHHAQNAALEIIKNGWATALRHRKDDLSRSPFYTELLAAEEAAQAKKLGIFAVLDKTSGKSKKIGTIVDASESVVRARGYLASLERRNKVPAIVELVISAGRLRLLVPSENCELVAVLDGVRVPRASEPFAEEALQYTTREWNQRDIQVTVRSVDKTGAFVASLYKKGASLAHELLSLGFASIHEASANASGLRTEYDAIQEEAQSKRLGMWKDYDPSAGDDFGLSAQAQQLEISEGLSGGAADSGAAGSGNSDTTSYQDAVISHVALDSIYVRLLPDEKKYQQLKSDLLKFFTAASNTGSRTWAQKPRRREIVVLDQTYERAVIRALIPSKAGGSTYEVELIDSGDVKTVQISDIFPAPKQFASIEPLAKPLVLRYVHRPVKGYESQYLKYLSGFVNKPVVIIGNIVYTADSANSTDSLNSRIVANGYASVPVAQASEEGAAVVLQLQEEVKNKRKGMWEYGDPREDDDL